MQTPVGPQKAPLQTSPPEDRPPPSSSGNSGNRWNRKVAEGWGRGKALEQLVAGAHASWLRVEAFFTSARKQC